MTIVAASTLPEKIRIPLRTCLQICMRTRTSVQDTCYFDHEPNVMSLALTIYTRRDCRHSSLTKNPSDPSLARMHFNPSFRTTLTGIFISLTIRTYL